MKPIAILRFTAADGPAYFADFIKATDRPLVEIRIDLGDTVPANASPFAGIGLMGGSMSVNDPLPWIPASLELIRDATEKNIPLIGHCLGGQLISKALGGTISRNPEGKEIGWHVLQIDDRELAEEWLDTSEPFAAFHWHGETFTLPAGARRLAHSARCANQAFILGPHIGMQFHIEMDEPTIANWCAEGADEIASALQKQDIHKAVMTTDTIKSMTPSTLPRMRAAADHLYRRWLQNAQD